MCFSAEVSFAAGAVLSVGGIVALKKTTAKDQVLFACIPLIFAVQQFSEGMLWLSYTHDGFEKYRQAAIVVFLIFAQVIWPFWVPFSVLKLETIPLRRNILKFFMVVGGTLSIYVVYCLIFYPVNAYPQSHHLKYELGFPLAHSILAAIFYFVPTVLSCVISSVKRMTTLGLVIFASYGLARLFFSEYSLSVWCFFSAVISVGVIYVIHLMRPVSTGQTNRSTHAMEG